MNNFDFDEWDPDFIEKVFQEEEKLSTQRRLTPPPLQSLPPPLLQSLPPPQPLPQLGYSHENPTTSHSPPRILSQRTTDYRNVPLSHTPSGNVTPIPHVCISRNANEVEIDRLKKELGHVKNQLTNLEQECLELREERDKKEEQLKSVFSQIETREAQAQCLKSRNLEHEVSIQDYPKISLQCRNAKILNEQVGSQLDTGTSTSKSIGVQTDKASNSTHLIENSDLSILISNKLLAIWGSLSGQSSGRDLVSKLFLACSTDFHVLFGCLNVDVPSNIKMDFLEHGYSSDVGLQNHSQSVHSSEAGKVSHLYGVLTKIGNGMAQLDALFEALLSICNLENVVLVYRSLRITRMVLNHLLSLERKTEKRENVMVEGLGSTGNIVDFHGSESAEAGGLFYGRNNEISCSGQIPFGMTVFDSEIQYKKGHCNHGIAMSCIDWVSLFELMHRIATRHTEEHVRYEAACIMNLIIMKSDAYLEREKFGQPLVFGSVSQLLKKEAGSRVRKQAVHLLYLVLNCPKLLVIFCCGATANDETKNVFSIILEDLADCLVSFGNDAQGLKLGRKVVTVLAFLASSGNPGFELVSSCKLSKGTNFLILILQALESVMDIEAKESTVQPEMFKERTLLIREALIFLNRLVSNPTYSATVLQILTNGRDEVSLTIDIASRLSRKGHTSMRESEIADLAQVFRKRVFTFLEENSLENPNDFIDLT